MPGRSGEPVVTTLVCLLPHLHARLRVHQAPGFPAPSAFRGLGSQGKTRAKTRGENAGLCLSRHCEPTSRRECAPDGRVRERNPKCRPCERRDPYSAAIIVQRVSNASVLTDKPRSMGPGSRPGRQWRLLTHLRDLAARFARGLPLISLPSKARAQGIPGA